MRALIWSSASMGGFMHWLWTLLWVREQANWMGHTPWMLQQIHIALQKLRQWSFSSSVQFSHSVSSFLRFSSVQFTSSVMSNSLWPHEPQHARPPCPSPTPGVHPNPCPLCRWHHPTISSSVVPFSSCPQSFPAKRRLNRNEERTKQTDPVID